MQRCVLLLLLTILISACDVVQSHKFRSYIMSYYDYQEFGLNLSDSGNIIIEGLEANWMCDWKSKGREKVIYDSLCVLHNDMSYNKKRNYIAGPDWGLNYKGDIQSIDVVSNADFDIQHPANSSLNDIIRFISVSLYPYILSGYKDTYDWEHNLPESFHCEKQLREQANYNEAVCYHPVNKKLSELTSLDLILVDLKTFLVFEKQPDIVKEHELTVTIQLSDSKVFTPKITKIFK